MEDDGQHVANLVPLDPDDEVLDAKIIRDFKENESLLFMTKYGMAKRTQLSLYQAQRHSKPLMALKLKAGDEVVAVLHTDGNKELFAASTFGYGLWFSESDVSLVGQRAAGVKGMNLKEGDEIVGIEAFGLEETVEFICALKEGQ